MMLRQSQTAENKKKMKKKQSLSVLLNMHWLKVYVKMIIHVARLSFYIAYDIIFHKL